MLLIAAGSMSSFRAAADPTPTQAYSITFFNNQSFNFIITNFTYSVTSSQRPALFQPPYTYTASGTTSQPPNEFDFGGYWFTPSSTNPLTITVNAGATATVQNTFNAARSFRLGLELAAPNGTGLPTLIFGTPVTIPALGTATLSFPSGAVTFQNGSVPSITTGTTYPAPIGFFISN
jgi:hypothetical protein